MNVIRKKFNFKKLNNFFKKKYYEPELQTEFSPYLYKIASTSIDISDGLAQDLQHLCSNSGFGASVNLNLLPFSVNARYLINKKLVDIKIFFLKVMIIKFYLLLNLRRSLKNYQNIKKIEN